MKKKWKQLIWFIAIIDASLFVLFGVAGILNPMYDYLFIFFGLGNLVIAVSFMVVFIFILLYYVIVGD